MNEATLRQIEAARPDASTWLSANAGSGKTRVLTDRVARLLLGGTPPQNILCLTFTKAAAGEMQNRLFARLGAWAMKPDAELAAELAAIGVPGGIGPDRLARARRLFARAIETPGGLKIQTIHSFCAAILRQFPLEAGVSPAFREIDDRAARLLKREVFDRLAEGAESAVVAEFARHCSAAGLDATLDEIAGHADAFSRPVPEEEILGWYGLVPGLDRAAVLAGAFDADARAAVADIAAALWAGTEANRRAAAEFDALAGMEGEAAFAALCGLVLTRTREPRKPLLKALDKQDPATAGAALALAGHLNAVLDRLLALEEVGRTLALHRFGRAYVAAWGARKAAAGLLDFDDLIRATLRLLSDPAVAQWVLFRLDGGIDHILVDEAQDTSPAQWAIIEKLAQEFTAGAGARGPLARTVFAVGDQKQSIYSFQGADPAEFARMRDHFARQMAAAGGRLEVSELRHSFRSAPLLLRLVDRVFDGSRTRGAGEPTGHVAFRDGLPGRVDLWPLIAPEDRPDPPDWHDTSDRTVPQDGALVLAERLAAEVARMLAEERIPGEDGAMRPLTAGDILVLVRRRSFVSDPLILALKRQGVEVAGADQIVLASELAVMDVVAVLKVLVTPADDLSLAAALRSPIFGLSEGDLYALAQPRGAGEELWEALERQRDRFPEAAAVLEDLRRQADYLRPFELIGRLLIRHNARRRLRARLGDEVDEALDVLLQQAMAYEASEVPSLTGFLAWHEAEGVKIKRQSEGAGGKLRVMTVHGAKGLEAPVVILPDTADHRPAQSGRIIARDDGQPLFRAPQDRRPAILAPLYEAEAQRAEEEANRLLYVALTRAKCWLILCGAGKDGAKEGRQPCWHRLVAEPLAALSPRPVTVAGQEILRLEEGGWPAPQRRDKPLEPVAAEVPLPAWAALPAEPGPPLPRFLSPSRLGAGEAPAAGESDLGRDEALRRGTQLHLLLEHLPLHPPAEWERLAAALLRQDDPPPLDAEIAGRLAEARAVLSAPGLEWLFSGESLAEVDVASDLPRAGARLYGRIDRLARRPDGSLLAVDYKSNAVVPDRPEDIPEGILMQLGAYVFALRRIFPGTPVGAAVLWTRTGRLMEVPEALALGALARIPET